MLKGKICCITKDFLGQQLLPVSQKAALPCLMLLVLLSRSVRSLRLRGSLLGVGFCLKQFSTFNGISLPVESEESIPDEFVLDCRKHLNLQIAGKEVNFPNCQAALLMLL